MRRRSTGRRVRIAGWLRLVGLAALAVVLGPAGCTGPQPEPVPVPAPEPPPAPTAAGLRAAVVVPPVAGPGDPQAAQLRALGNVSAHRLPDGVGELRMVTPDGPAFVGDLARLFARRGTDLVCLVGDDGGRLATELAERHPRTRFCVVPATAAPGADRPDGVWLVDVRFEELGHLVGVAAAAAAGDGAVAAVLAPDRVGMPRFRAGLRAGVGGTELHESFPTSAAAAADAVAQAAAEGASVLVLDVGWQTDALLATARDAGLRLSAPMEALAGERFEASTVLAWSVRWQPILLPVVEAVVADEVETEWDLGLVDDVFVLTPGPLAERDPLDAAYVELRDGVRSAIPGAPARAGDPAAPEGTDPPTEGTDPPTEGTDPPTEGTDPPTEGADPPTEVGDDGG
ncbi:hypothetical protein GCM10011354_31450 [Egicoccus halophilus]|uniref:Uncharacterized protein n=1 Tax=Egicoccus halophilus TaxID=1670830 RepID=A0A8J3AAU3_9ACTN|nr:hypothetical protein GCM10011354_31450 [Egicoccus halophilus]